MIGFVLLVLEVGLVAHLRPLGGGPDLVFLFAVFLALYGPVEDAPLSGWFLGMGKDALSEGTFGLFAVLFMGITFFLSRIRGDIFLEYNKSHVVNAGLAAFVTYSAAGLWHCLEGADFPAMVVKELGVVVWTAALAPFAFRVFFRFSRLLETSRRPK